MEKKGFKKIFFFNQGAKWNKKMGGRSYVITFGAFRTLYSGQCSDQDICAECEDVHWCELICISLVPRCFSFMVVGTKEKYRGFTMSKYIFP